MTPMVIVIVLTVAMLVVASAFSLRRQRERRHRSMVAPSPHLTLTPRAERDAGSALRLLSDDGLHSAPRHVVPARLPHEPARVIGDEMENDNWVLPAGRHNSQWALQRSLSRSRVTWPVITVVVSVGVVIAILIVAGLIMGHHAQ